MDEQSRTTIGYAIFGGGMLVLLLLLGLTVGWPMAIFFTLFAGGFALLKIAPFSRRR
ncbi:hypothetical protein [Gordonia sp. (in: high G+C Gram-positive bacteria)]|uniref:hypothetical protein n=1 Tax=Gordonia sp. (in: high G+C Gram-positive bacteria) TaxID=84139 RepID=UPI0039E69EEC